MTIASTIAAPWFAFMRVAFCRRLGHAPISLGARLYCSRCQIYISDRDG